MNNNDLGARVRSFRLARKWSTQKMADEVGTSRQNIEGLEAKGFGQPRYIAGLARVMGVSVEDLLGTPETKGSKKADVEPFSLIDSSAGLKSIPILDFKDARLMEVMNDDPRLAAAPRLAAMADSGPRVKALRVEDDAMTEAGVQLGDLVTLDPDTPPLAGDVVLVVDKSGAYYLREYRVRKGGQFEAAARNAAHPTFQSSEDGLRVVAVTTHLTKPMRRRPGGAGSSLLGFVGTLFASLVIVASDICLPSEDDERWHPPHPALARQAYC